MAKVSILCVVDPVRFLDTKRQFCVRCPARASSQILLHTLTGPLPHQRLPSLENQFRALHLCSRVILCCKGDISLFPWLFVSVLATEQGKLNGRGRTIL